MASSARDGETAQPAETLAVLTGETKTQAVTEALRDRPERIRRRRAGRRLAAGLRSIPIGPLAPAGRFASRARDDTPRSANSGDGFARALAETLDRPWSFKGRDLVRTDLVIHRATTGAGRIRSRD